MARARRFASQSARSQRYTSQSARARRYASQSARARRYTSRAARARRYITAGAACGHPASGELHLGQRGRGATTREVLLWTLAGGSSSGVALGSGCSGRAPEEPSVIHEGFRELEFVLGFGIINHLRSFPHPYVLCCMLVTVCLSPSDKCLNIPVDRH